MQYEELMLTRGFQSSSDTKMHFGLDTAKMIDSVLIVWPDQKYQLIKNISANKPLSIDQKNAADTFHYNIFFPKKKEILEDLHERWERETEGKVVFMSAIEKRNLDLLRKTILDRVREVYKVRYPYKTEFLY
jgi:50S ribosomal subunit-associated GTPase HflX